MTVKLVRLGPKPDKPPRVINLRDLGFVGNVSDEARAEIQRNADRANMVLRTADRFWFR